MKFSSHRQTRSRRHQGSKAFTLVEIAISLAVIAFALVAIIGVLPTGMQVQRDNREETIINQEAMVISTGMRKGIPPNGILKAFEYGSLDELTNAVAVIENFWAFYEVRNGATNLPPETNYCRYTYTNGFGTTAPRESSPSIPVVGSYGISNGTRIVGLLSTPKYIHFEGTGFVSNYIIAYVRALSGPAAEKAPQDNAEVRRDAFTYKLYCDNQEVPLPDYETGSDYGKNLRGNLRDLRLNFRWPLLNNGNAGNGRQVFRFQVTGDMAMEVPDPVEPSMVLYFFQPTTFAKK